MMTSTAARRSAAVVMVSLVTMLLVATGGSARALSSRTSAGTGHASAAPHSARQVAAAPVVAADPVVTHLDLASTPPAAQPAPPSTVDVLAAETSSSYLPVDAITATGRAPPSR